jgi:hypothetical protein
MVGSYLADYILRIHATANQFDCGFTKRLS